MKKFRNLFIIIILLFVLILSACAQTQADISSTKESDITSPSVADIPNLPEESFAFMTDDRFAELDKEGVLLITDPAFRHDSNQIVVKDTIMNRELIATLPYKYVFHGVEYDVYEPYRHIGRRVYCLFTAPMYEHPTESLRSQPTLQFDVVSGHLVAITGVEIANVGMNKSVEEYANAAKQTIADYMPHIDVSKISLYNTLFFDENTTDSSGHLLFEYKYLNIPTSVSIEVIIREGIIHHIQILGYFDLPKLLKDAPTIKQNDMDSLLESFARYSCNKMEMEQWTINEQYLIEKEDGTYAMEYVISVNAKDNEIKRTSMFNIRIDLD